MLKVNAMGDTCPIPVVKTKDAIRQLGADGGVVERFLGLRNGDPQRENAVGAA